MRLSVRPPRSRRTFPAVAGAAGVLLAASLVAMTGQPAAATSAPVPSAARGQLSATGRPALSAPAMGQAPAKAPSRAGTPAPQLPANDAAVCAPAPAPGQATCLAIRRTDVQARRGLFPRRRGAAPDAASVPAPAGYGPLDLQNAYNLPSGTAGAGRTVAIVDAYDDPSAEADLQVYRAQYGLPACTTANGCFRKVAQDGSANLPGASGTSGWATEESLDLDAVSAVCPLCHILLVEASDTSILNLGAAVNTAVALGASYVSNSYGALDSSQETTWDTEFYNHPGVVVTASGGDAGFFGGVLYPAASQYVTAVGGTTLTRDASSQRGWDESAWTSGGSGCSAYEPKPAWQTDGGCANRTLDDISADANPSTGIAVYDTFDQAGWNVIGGTSLSAPVIAAGYALAGAPLTGSNPASYPYASTSAINDVTTGLNGRGCTPAPYLCTAGPGYDGPTGLGAPAGVAALSAGPTGALSGAVADGAGPLAGARVTASGLGYTATATADASGGYHMVLPPGTYTLTARDFGHTPRTATVTVGAGQATAPALTLPALPTTSVTGTVTDGSGAGWPLSAKVAIPGTTVSTHTDPRTGRYTLTVPQNTTVAIAADPAYPGYHEAQQQASTGTAGATVNLTPTVNAAQCSAPGYAPVGSGSTQAFDTSAAPAGWSVANLSGSDRSWGFTNPPGLPNETGGSGNFALVYSADGTAASTELISPVTNLSQDSTPVVQFNSDYQATGVTNADVDVSIDGGQTWTTVWQGPPLGKPGPDLETVPLPMAAGQASVQVRFTYLSFGDFWWAVDNVFIGNQVCLPQSGGLIEGTVTDRNTGAVINGAAVHTAAGPALAATDPAAGTYVLFAPAGPQTLTASKAGYQPQTAAVTVTAGAVTAAAFSLAAGRIAVAPGPVTATTNKGGAVTRQLTFTNTGDAPATVSLAQDPGGPAPAPPAGNPWTTLPSYPLALGDNAAATDPATGIVYSVGGEGNTRDGNDAFAYNPATGQWTALPNMQFSRNSPVAAFINGKLYVAGGMDETIGNIVPQLEIYDPASRTWSAGASIPHPLLGSAVAVVNGQMYVVGGCDVASCDHTEVQVYNPSGNTWSTAASYPVPFGYGACGGINGRLYCAGGAQSFTTNVTNTVSTSDGFAYDPGSDTWSPIAPYPASAYAMAYATAGGRLLVMGGIVGFNVQTSQGWAYDPALNTWTALPNSNTPVSFGAGACGFYTVAGRGSSTTDGAVVQQLRGFGGCGPASVPWLSENSTGFTVSPGQQVTVAVTLNSADQSITSPGAYTAALRVNTSTPYNPAPVSITMNVTAPAAAQAPRLHR
jgi:N-acetylneuraminic acid mutarotase